MADNEEAHRGDEEVVEVEPLNVICQNILKLNTSKQVRDYLIGCIGLLYYHTIKVMENGSDI